jgi:hypothetical protein
MDRINLAQERYQWRDIVGSEILLPGSEEQYLVAPDGMGTVVYEEMIIAVQLQEVEPEHEPLQDRMGLEGDDAVEVPLVLRLQHSPVYLPVQQRQEVVLAE